jgi:ATP-binding cassette subfamily B multidrug efflux pump
LRPLLKLFEVASELFTPFLTKYMIDRGIANKDWKYTLILGAVMLAMAIVGFLVTMVAQWMAARVSADYGYDLRKVMFAHLGSP